MTSHLHLIAGCDAKPVTEVIRDFKRHTATTLLSAIENNPQESRREWMMERFRKAGSQNPHNWQYQFWQQDNYPFELYSQQVIEQKTRYIYDNPVVAGMVQDAEAYLYSTCSKHCPLQVM